MANRENYTIQFRKDTAVRWATFNPVLGNGEPGYEIGAGRFKIGDGSTAWNDLRFHQGSAYDIAQDHGFFGTEEEWVASLKGEKGDAGDNGRDGDNGAPGAEGRPGMPTGWYHPENYGAKGDGITDDTDSFNAMMTAIWDRGEGGTVYCREDAVYLISSVLIHYGVTIEGNGCTFLRPAMTPNWTRMLTTGDDAETTRLPQNYEDHQRPIILRNFRMDGNLLNQGAFRQYQQEQSSLLFLNGLEDSPFKQAVTIDNVEWIGSVSDGVHVWVNTNTTINNCRGIDCFRGGITVTGGHNTVRVNGYTGTGQLTGAHIDVELDTLSNGMYQCDLTFRDIYIEDGPYNRPCDFHAEHGGRLTLENATLRSGWTMNAPDGKVVIRDSILYSSDYFEGLYTRMLYRGTDVTFTNCKFITRGRRNILNRTDMSDVDDWLPTGGYEDGPRVIIEGVGQTVTYTGFGANESDKRTSIHPGRKYFISCKVRSATSISSGSARLYFRLGKYGKASSALDARPIPTSLVVPTTAANEWGVIEGEIDTTVEGEDLFNELLIGYTTEYTKEDAVEFSDLKVELVPDAWDPPLSGAYVLGHNPFDAPEYQALFKSVTFESCRFETEGDLGGEEVVGIRAASNSYESQEIIIRNCSFGTGFQTGVSAPSGGGIKLQGNNYFNSNEVAEISSYDTEYFSLEVDQITTGPNVVSQYTMMAHSATVDNKISHNNTLVDESNNVFLGSYGASEVFGRRVIMVTEGPDMGPIPAFIGDIARLKNPVLDEVYEWYCTAGDIDWGGTWQALTIFGASAAPPEIPVANSTTQTDGLLSWVAQRDVIENIRTAAEPLSVVSRDGTGGGYFTALEVTEDPYPSSVMRRSTVEALIAGVAPEAPPLADATTETNGLLGWTDKRDVIDNVRTAAEPFSVVSRDGEGNGIFNSLELAADPYPSSAMRRSTVEAMFDARIGDSGWRNITNICIDETKYATGHATSGMSIRRYGNKVSATFWLMPREDNTQSIRSVSNLIVNVPLGFQMDTVSMITPLGNGMIYDGNFGNYPIRFVANSTPDTVVFTGAALTSISYPGDATASTWSITGSMEWFTADAWPSPLPGLDI